MFEDSLAAPWQVDPCSCRWNSAGARGTLPSETYSVLGLTYEEASDYKGLCMGASFYSGERERGFDGTHLALSRPPIALQPPSLRSSLFLFLRLLFQRKPLVGGGRTKQKMAERYPRAAGVPGYSCSHPKSAALYENFDIHHNPIIGVGHFGELRRVDWFGTDVAAKMIYTCSLPPPTVGDPAETTEESRRPGQRKDFREEVEPWRTLVHPNIARLLDVVIPDEFPRKPPLIVTELYSRSLRALVVNKGPMSHKQVLDLSSQISYGLCFLHERDAPVMHGNLTSNNVLLTYQNVCKISDVGLAQAFEERRLTLHEQNPTTRAYMPIAVLYKMQAFDHRVDVYSLGILVLEMLIGGLQYEEDGTQLLDDDGTPIAERKRRERDFEKLPDDHLLLPLLVQLMSPIDERPRIAAVAERFSKLLASHKEKVPETTEPTDTSSVAASQVFDKLNLLHDRVSGRSRLILLVFFMLFLLVKEKHIENQIYSVPF